MSLMDNPTVLGHPRMDGRGTEPASLTPVPRGLALGPAVLLAGPSGWPRPSTPGTRSTRISCCGRHLSHEVISLFCQQQSCSSTPLRPPPPPGPHRPSARLWGWQSPLTPGRPGGGVRSLRRVRAPGFSGRSRSRGECPCSRKGSPPPVPAPHPGVLGRPTVTTPPRCQQPAPGVPAGVHSEAAAAGGASVPGGTTTNRTCHRVACGCLRGDAQAGVGTSRAGPQEADCVGSGLVPVGQPPGATPCAPPFYPQPRGGQSWRPEQTPLRLPRGLPPPRWPPCVSPTPARPQGPPRMNSPCSDTSPRV